MVASMDKIKVEQLVELKVETMAATWVEERVTWMDGMKVALWVVGTGDSSVAWLVEKMDVMKAE